MPPLDTRRLEVRLVLPGGEERAVAIGTAPFVVGRGRDVDLRLDDAAVSRRHLELVREGGRLLARDLGSAVGTVLNDAPLSGTRAIGPGDRIAIGPFELRVALVEGSPAGDEPVGRPGVLTGDLERDRRNVESLLSTIAELHSMREPAEVLARIVDRAIQLAGGSRGAVLLAGEGKGTLEGIVVRDAEGRDLPPGEAVPRSLPARALAEGRAVVLTDADDPEQRGDATPSVVSGALRSVLAVPLPSAGGPLGVLYVDSRRPADGFGPAELAFYEALAAQGAIALERSDRERRERRRLEDENVRLRARLALAEPIGRSPLFLSALELVDRVAPTGIAVLFLGETGTGKEIFARRVHARGPRPEGPFVVVDCGSIPANLVESELFGHVRGAFTGADEDRPGRFRSANGGTLFLDEVGELPLETQPKLLRALQERTVTPVGGVPVGVDVRIVAATNRDLSSMASSGEFRADLYYRLAGAVVEIPALEKREDDVRLLAEAFLERFAAALGRPLVGFSRDALDRLRSHGWPGNVRELEHAVHRAAVLAEPPLVRLHDLGLPGAEESVDSGAIGGETLPLPDARRLASDRFERDYLVEVLGRTEGNVTRAARLAGVSRQLLQRLMRRHGL